MGQHKNAFSVKEAAEYLGISINTLYDWRKNKITNQPKSHRMGRKVVYYLDDLEFFKEKNEEIGDRESA